MTRSKALLRLTLLSGIWILGCSKDTPTQPDYGSPALVVEGTEVWEPLQWGWRGQFDRSDADGNQKIDPGEFTAKIRREALAQRALKVFGILDTDGDGQLAWEEYRLKPGEATIVSLDVNGNGTLSSDEFAASKQSLVNINRLQPLFVVWDRNGDGELTAEELENPPRENGFFDRDTDGDLRLSGEELLAKSKTDPNKAERDLVYRDRDFDGMLSLREYLYSPRNSKYWAMDNDGDMSVDKKEFSASKYAKQFQDPTDVFDKLDLNSDGRIGVGEFRERVVDVAAVFGTVDDSRLGNTKRAFAILDRNSDEILVANEVLPNEPTSSDSKWEELFQNTDSDKDKKVTLEEFGKRASAYNFLVVDDNRDGRVSEAELHTGTMSWMSPKRSQEFFALADVDEDGMLNFDEFRDRSQRTEFLDYDTDEDNHVSLEEFGQRKGHLMHNGRIRSSFAARDLDGSGDLSRDEFENAPQIVEFLERDENNDSYLTLEELTARISGKSSLNWRKRMHGQKDKDNDGRLSYREFLNDRDLAFFWEMDEDGNNVVSPNEFKKSERFSRLAALADTFFRSLDLNRNGELEVQEYEKRSDGAVMTELDQDGDSSLTLKEFAQSGYSRPRLAYEAFDLADKDADGKLTLEEFQKRPDEEALKPPADAPSPLEAAFAFLDVDKDQKIVPDEFATYAQKAQMGSAADRVFSNVDRNDDDALTIDEFKKRQEPLRFLFLDKDKDGALSAREYWKYAWWATNERNEALLAALDSDRSGNLQYPEFSQQWNVARLLLEDRNENGTVELDEYRKVRESKMEANAIAREFDAFDDDGSKTLTVEELAHTPFTKSFLDKDTNGDGSVTAEEFLASAKSPKEKENRTREFNRLDKNGDQSVNLREQFFGPANAKFWSMDTNGDLQVDAEEFAASKHARRLSKPEAAFKALDRNGDGMFSIAEYHERSSDVAPVFGLKTAPWPTDVNLMFARLDRDGDGTVVAAEVLKEGVDSTVEFEESLADMDKDGDGKVTLAEFKKRAAPFHFPVWDTDRDGALSTAEFRTSEISWATDQQIEKIFKAVDSNGDGAISVEEFRTRKKQAPMLLADWDEDDNISYDEFSRQNGRYQDLRQMRLAFEAYDRNGDARLSRDEFTERPAAMGFIDRDTNGDSLVDQAEFCSVAKSPKAKAAREKDFAKKDSDANGTLTLEEFQKQPEKKPSTPPADEAAEAKTAFALLDADKDDKVVRDEFATYAQKAQMAAASDRVFNTVDRNHDGNLTLDEFKKGREPLRFLFLDQNGDGNLSPLEYKTYVSWATNERLEALVAAIDSDHSGDLQYTEFKRQWSIARPLLEDKNENGTVEFNEYRRVRASKMDANAISREFEAFDCDGSKTLTAQELARSPFTKSFLDRDVNGDGLVTAEEFLANAKSPKEQENRTREFSRLDKDENGQVTLREQYFGPANAKFWSMDTNGDQQVDAKEFTTSKYAQTLSDPNDTFRALDRNGDGRFCIAEFHERSNDVASAFGLTTPRPWPSDVNLMFARLDRNGNGTVVAAEAIKKGVKSTVEFEKPFAAMDKDNDGKVTLAEFKNRAAPFQFPVWDTDQDGTLSPEEFRASEISWATDQQIEQIFKAVDSDGDGAISVNEFRARKKQAPLLLADWDEDGNLSYDEFSRQNSQYLDRGQMKLVFRTFDRDGNGQLSESEFTERPVAMNFIDRDTNGDGLVDKKEFCAVAKSPEAKATREKDFAKKDSDANGKLTQDEFFATATGK